MPVKINESKDHILKFLSSKNVGVLATCGKSRQPHASAVYFFHDDDLNFYFMTKEGTRKSQDLASNGRVSFAVYEERSQTTLQAEGTVKDIQAAKEANRIFDEILKVSLEVSQADPPVSKLIDGGYQACRFTPSSIRLASYQHPPEGDWQNIFLTV